ncbi:hypothetical protein IVB14_21540 [Bradyrhizobium sp. 180]|uniref:hypothetical protein n=1 Tax=unclassified Bradyrhizobium TaxID=2631580 RepID=UPI001FF9F998|nr:MULTISPECIES: hypothetical protein [unclassified Bradyrhizobium]MCK1422937.1 hypothetical protein [Bradyrhizobium sp. CW12]MCK1492939.1 hypothetical protein [Bradyrhizobium sp. 180]MCK1531583.1 hypothetical protein [Bradyrhizobium sp. 182]MCK1599272.1 hypothetical protein [Bradyrhizobium sp. 164]MCK1647084.1 hypothetical protein [Bradyrhizobium sp. 154]
MSEPKKDAPRRYIVDGAGQRVLVGLTISETLEFETLDNPDARLRAGLPDQEPHLQQNEHGARWLELYVKHERAWNDWMAETRAQPQKPCLLN